MKKIPKFLSIGLLVLGVLSLIFTYLEPGYWSHPLHDAVRDGDIARVETLLSKGADVNISRVNKGFTALHLAAMEGHKEIVQLLLEKGRPALLNASRNIERIAVAVLQCFRARPTASNWRSAFCSIRVAGNNGSSLPQSGTSRK